MTKPLAVAAMLPLTATILVIASIPNSSQFAAEASTWEDIIGGGPDSDSDGLSDTFEAKLGSDPTLPDSDSDGLADGIEHTGGDTGTRTDPTESDTDSDGLSDSFEIIQGTSPIDKDNDDDGLLDGLEKSSGTDPNERDSDNDGLSDSLELLTHLTNPLAQDTDGDGVTDNIEVWHGSDPQAPESFFVLPESPLGPIVMILASMGAFAGFLYVRNVRRPSAIA